MGKGQMTQVEICKHLKCTWLDNGCPGKCRILERILKVLEDEND